MHINVMTKFSFKQIFFAIVVSLILLVCVSNYLDGKIISLRLFTFNKSDNLSYFDDPISKNSSIFDSNQSFECSTLSNNFHLWSQEADQIDWSPSLDMCRNILYPSTISKESRREAFEIARKWSILAKRSESREAFEIARKWTIPKPHTDRSIFELLSNCTRFRRLIPFPTRASSSQESNFPLAYVFVGQKRADQTIRVLRSIYQPQNSYCLTYDNKSDDIYKNSIRRFADCFEGENVFLSPNVEDIYWGDYSILRSVMECMKLLLDRPWKYIQIISYNDYPIRTNLEMVKYFDILNGSQDSALLPLMPHYFVYNWDLHKGNIWLPEIKKTVVPDGLTMYKGNFATSMSKEFVDFLFTNPTSQRFYEWLTGSKCAEEHYWQTLIFNTQLNAPGNFPGQCLHFYQEYKNWKPFMSRYQIWNAGTGQPLTEIPCKGKYTHLSCVYGVEDLATIVTRPELIAHKFYQDFEPAALFCLEYWLYNRTCDQEGQLFNEGFYKNLPNVRYQNMKNKTDFFCL